MNKKDTVRILFAFSLVLIFIYLGFRLYAEKQFREQYPYSGMNSKIQFLRPKMAWNSFKINEVVYLELKNISSDDVGIQFETDLKMVYYDYQTWRWQETTNNVEYVPANVSHILTPYQSNNLTALDIAVIPVRGARFGIQTIRILALGEIYKNNQPTGEITAAYIDVILHK